MKSIDIAKFNEESFVEEQIIDYKIDIKNKKIYMVINGGCLDDGSYLNKTKIYIEDWYDLKINQIGTNEQKELDVNNVKFISNILKFQYEKNVLVLYDVGDYCWITWTFLDAKISVYGE